MAIIEITVEPARFTVQDQSDHPEIQLLTPRGFPEDGANQSIDQCPLDHNRYPCRVGGHSDVETSQSQATCLEMPYAESALSPHEPNPVTN